MASSFIATSKTVITRGWRDIEPKLYAALVSGGLVSAVLIVLALIGIHVSAPVLTLLPVLASLAAGYIKASTHKGDLLAALANNGATQVHELVPLLEAAVPAAAPEITAVDQILAALDPAGASTSLSPVIEPVPAVPAPAAQVVQ